MKKPDEKVIAPLVTKSLAKGIPADEIGEITEDIIEHPVVRQYLDDMDTYSGVDPDDTHEDIREEFRWQVIEHIVAGIVNTSND